MGQGDVRELLVTLIGYASIVSAAMFGLLGLFTEYKKDGRITVWGRLAAGGIALSALFAMTSAVLQQQLNAEQQQTARDEAAADLKRQEKQFNTQLGKLADLNRQLGGVNRANSLLLGRMESSLNSQRQLLGNARRNLLLTTALGAQQRQSTIRVLKSLWDDANRITGERLELLVNTTCSPDRPALNLFNGGIAFVELLTAEEAQAELGGQVSGLAALAGLERAFFSQQQEFTGSAMSDDDFSRTRFYAFTAFFPDAVSDPETWRKSHVAIRLESPISPDHQILQRTERGEVTNLRLSPHRRGEDRELLPCDAAADLIANGRILLGASAPIEVVRGRDGPTLRVLFDPTIVDDELLPRFAGTSGR